MRDLGIQGGPPAVETEIPINQPTLPRIEEVSGSLSEVLDSRQITNGRFVNELQERVRELTGARHAIAVSSCTSGLLLALQALDGKGKHVVLPSFTFPATAHAARWNGLQPRFADCEEDTFNLSPAAAAEALDDEAKALVAVPIFGNPVRGRELRRLARLKRVPVVYDAAHALGARSEGLSVCRWADVAVFSLAPTKVVPAGEGGVITTDDDEIADRLRVGRNYGNPGDYDCRFHGLNARMSEFHAVIALFGLARLEAAIARRSGLVDAYRRGLAAVPGVGFQVIDDEDRSSHNYFAIRVDPEEFGLHVAELARALAAENVGCRRYFYPPVHRQRAYAEHVDSDLAVTDRVADRVLCLPLFTHLEESQLDLVCEVVAEIQIRAPEVREALVGSTVRSVGGVR